MSIWSYVTGWIQCAPFGRTQEEKEYVLKTVLNHLPTVSGSEEDMYIHTFPKGGYDISSDMDEYGNFTGKRYRVQTYYYIFVEGHFRDRTYKETYRQFAKWLARLAKRIEVVETNVEIMDRCGNNSAIQINRSLYDLVERPSWCYHLLWSEGDTYKKTVTQC